MLRLVRFEVKSSELHKSYLFIIKELKNYKPQTKIRWFLVELTKIVCTKRSLNYQCIKLNVDKNVENKSKTQH